MAQAALTGEGALALFKTGFFGAFTRTYYPASLIAAINKLWASQADVLALPVGKSSAGLPVSMQLVGRCFDDPLLMRVAYAYQHSTNWDTIISVQA